VAEVKDGASQAAVEMSRPVVEVKKVEKQKNAEVSEPPPKTHAQEASRDRLPPL